MNIKPTVTLINRVNYLARMSYYRHICDLCEDYLDKIEDPVVRFWWSFGYLMEGNINEAIRGFNVVQNKSSQMKLAAIMGLIAAQEQSGQPDHEEIQTLKDERDALHNVSDSARVQAALFQAHLGNFSQARMLMDEVDAAFKDHFGPASAYKGWIGILSGRSIALKDIENQFSKFLKESTFQQYSLWFQTGLVQIYSIQKRYDECISELNKIIVQNENFIPALTMKAEFLIANDNVTDAKETIQRVLEKKDPQNIDALMLDQLCKMMTESNSTENLKGLQALIDAIENSEKLNHELFHRVAKIFGSLSGGNIEIVDACLKLASKASSIAPFEASYLSTIANFHLLKSEDEKAENYYNQALEYDGSNMDANKGIIKCLLVQKRYQDAKMNLESLNQLQETLGDSMGLSAELTFLNALYIWRSEKKKEKTIELLDKTMEEFIAATKDEPISLDYFSKFNPQFLLELAIEYNYHCPTEAREKTDPPSNLVGKCETVLKHFTRIISGSLEGQLLLAKMKYVNREFERAQKIVDTCLQLRSNYAEAELLASQIAFSQGDYKASQKALGRALSTNFKVDSWPEYNLALARVFRAKKNYQDSMNYLQKALKLATESGLMTSDYIKVSIYLEYAYVLSQLNKVAETNKIISDALDMFSGSGEEGRIHIVHAKICAARNDVDTSLRILNRIKPTDKYYMKAISEMAQIHLTIRRDKKAFAECFKKLTSGDNESAQGFISLGDAFMNIQEPEQAIEAYKRALDLEPEQPVKLLLKIGSALITTHEYHEAIGTFKKAIESHPEDSSIKFELSLVYMKLKKYDEAEQVISDAMKKLQDSPKDSESTEKLVKTLQLLSEIHSKNQNIDSAIKTLKNALTVQERLVSSAKLSEVKTSQQKIAADICFSIAQLHSMKDMSSKKTIVHLNEALKFYPDHIPALLARAETYLNKGDIEGCEKVCLKLLQVDESNEKATMILADIIWRKDRFDDAIRYFDKLLSTNANNYQVLSQLIDLLRRAGKLDEAEKYIKQAKKLPRAQTDPGFHYCKGIYYRFASNLHQSLKEFNLARTSPEWGELSVLNMIEIYLGEVIHWHDPSKAVTAQELGNKFQENIACADNLINELTTRTIPASKKDILKGYVHVAKRSKKDLNEAKRLFTLHAKVDPIGTMVGLATVQFVEKSTVNAKNQLVRIIRHSEYKKDHATEFERTWLMLSNIYISSSKYDKAQDFLQKAIDMNHSCIKAWELKGLIFEKEQSYQDAAECYEKAWKLSHQQSPVVGYKLGFNYLKAKKFVEAIDVAHQVLKSDPNYKSIQKDILHPARLSLRP